MSKVAAAEFLGFIEVLQLRHDAKVGGELPLVQKILHVTDQGERDAPMRPARAIYELPLWASRKPFEEDLRAIKAAATVPWAGAPGLPGLFPRDTRSR